jgi:hypothetical protein
MKFRKPLAVILLAGAAGGAQAAHVESGWYSWSQAYVGVNGGGPFAPGEASAHIVNGTLIPGNNRATNGSWAAGPVVPGATSVWAEVEAGNTAGESAFARAATSLAHGTMRATAGAFDPPPFSATVAVSSTAWLYETVWFTNSTAAMLPVRAWIDVEGSIAGTDPARSDLSWWMVGRLFTPDSGGCAAVCIAADAAGSNPFGTAFTAERSREGAFYFYDKAGDDIGNWSIIENPGHDPAAGLFDFRMSVTFWVPPGETTLAVNPQFQIIQCGADTTFCDFGNTASFRFGDMPEGLSWTSQSGVFLSDIGGGGVGGGGGVPEPSSWALLIAGFGLVGVAVRRRADLLSFSS